MATTTTKRTLETVDEVGGWITVKKAAEILGIQVASVSAKITEKKFRVVRIAGIILCEKESVVGYATERELAKVEADRKREESNAHKLTDWDKLSKMLEALTPEDRERVLAQLNGQG